MPSLQYFHGQLAAFQALGLSKHAASPIGLSAAEEFGHAIQYPGLYPREPSSNTVKPRKSRAQKNVTTAPDNYARSATQTGNTAKRLTAAEAAQFGDRMVNPERYLDSAGTNVRTPNAPHATPASGDGRFFSKIRNSKIPLKVGLGVGALAGGGMLLHELHKQPQMDILPSAPIAPLYY